MVAQNRGGNRAAACGGVWRKYKCDENTFDKEMKMQLGEMINMAACRSLQYIHYNIHLNRYIQINA